MTADLAITAALESLAAALDDLGAPAMIIGGIAVIARGVARTTLDVDATVWAEGLDLDRALEGFGSHEILPRIPDARRFAEENQVLLLRHEPSGTPLDVSLAWLPFEREALARATPVDFGGPSLPVVGVEDLIVYKAIAWRERDRSDIERLLALHRPTVNVERLRSLVAEFTRLLEDPERLADFDAIVARVGRAPR
jgi:hypothetical protein